MRRRIHKRTLLRTELLEQRHPLSVDFSPIVPWVPDPETYDDNDDYQNFDPENWRFNDPDGGNEADDAWDIAIGSRDIVVAVLDTGVDYTHESLYLNVWINQDEIPSDIMDDLLDVDGDGVISFYDLNDSANASYRQVSDTNSNNYIDAGDLLVDDDWEDESDNDGNGLEDDIVGWNMDDESNDPMDLDTTSGHGTSVAGVLAAHVDGYGATSGGGDAPVETVGVAPRVSILPIVVHGEADRVNRHLDALEYVEDLREAGVNIVAVNYSGKLFAGDFDVEHDITVYDYARKIIDLNHLGVLYTDSAGNEDWDLYQRIVVYHEQDWPSTFDFEGDEISQGLPGTIYEDEFENDEQLDGMINVTGICDDGALDFNWGFNLVELAAPGCELYLPKSNNISANGGGYWIDTSATSGSSFSAPQVAATAALIWAVNPDPHEGGATPDYDDVLAVRDFILSTVTSRASLDNKVTTEGSLNVHDAVEAAYEDYLSRFPEGDVNLDETVDASDIDYMFAMWRHYASIAVADQLEGDIIRFDLDSDGELYHFYDKGVDTGVQTLTGDVQGDGHYVGDIYQLIFVILESEVGDANEDGYFTSDDIVLVFGNGEYGDGDNDNSTWIEGDWDGDGDFTSDDLAIAGDIEDGYES